MKKNQILDARKALCFLIHFGFLISELGATDLIIDSSFTLSEKIQPFFFKKFSSQIFLNDSYLLDTQHLKKGAIVHMQGKIGEGGYGIIYQGSSEGKDLIIKQKKIPEKAKGLQKELENSNAFLDAIAEKLKQENLGNNQLFEILSGARLIVPVIAITKDGSLIQERIHGKDLKKAVSIADHQNLETPLSYEAPYNTSGFPDDLRETIIRAASYFLAVKTLHYAGFVHCDLKPGNVMIKQSTSFPCCIIDLGGLKKIGEKIEIHSGNGGPEYIEFTCMIKDYKLEQKNLKEECNQIAKNIKSASNNENIIKLKEQEKAIKKRLEEIAKLIKLAESTRCSIAQPSYDIYSSATILLVILFGKKGYQLAHHLYFPNTKGPIKFRYLQKARSPDFDAKAFFIKKFSKLNQLMKNITGRAYSKYTLNQLAKLQAKMSSLDCNERPFADDIFDELLKLSFPTGTEMPYMELMIKKNISCNPVPATLHLCLMERIFSLIFKANLSIMCFIITMFRVAFPLQGCLISGLLFSKILLESGLFS